MSPKPTLVFVPGAWFPADCWTKVAALLEAQGYETIAVSLPSSSATSDPSAATFLDDVTAVRTAVLAETKSGRDVVIVVHSYGAIPGHSAAKGLTKSNPEAAASAPGDNDGHVLGFAMISTGFTVTGMSFLDGLGGSPPPSWRADAASGLAVLMAPARELFFHDVLPESEGDAWAARLGAQSLGALARGGEHAYAAWRDAPSWYLETTEDRALPVEFQRMLVQMARDGGGDVTVRDVASGHAPMLSRPEDTAAFILEAVQDFIGRKG